MEGSYKIGRLHFFSNSIKYPIFDHLMNTAEDIQQLVSTDTVTKFQLILLLEDVMRYP